MIDKKTLATWLFELSRRPAGMPDCEHIAQLRTNTEDSTWALYLDSIRDYLSRGWSYGSAIADPMSIDLSKDVQARLRMSTDSAQVDEILLDASFRLLFNLSDHDKLKSMFDCAGYRYSLHRDYSRGRGPYDIDLYTAKTVSGPSTTLAGETINVSFRFTDAGDLDGVRSYSMGRAPANPLRRGEDPPDYHDVEQESVPQRSQSPLWLRLTAPVRLTTMTAPPKVIQFFQGWALQTDNITDGFENCIEIRGCARPFHRVELIEIADIGKPGLRVSQLGKRDRASMERLLAGPKVKWRLYPRLTRWEAHPYNCHLSFALPKTEQDVEAAKEVYMQEIRERNEE